MDGTTRRSQTWVANVPDTGYEIQGVADVTGDGKADVVAVGRATHNVKIYWNETK